MEKFLFYTLIVTFLWAGMAACQGTGATGETAGQTDTSPVPPGTIAPEGTPGLVSTNGAPSGLYGQVTAESDVSGQPDEPLAGQMVLAIPNKIAGEVLGNHTVPLTNEELRFSRVNITEANPAIAFTLSDATGNYTLLLDPGEYVLCLADSEKIPPDFPATTRGCGRIQVRPSELRRVDISSGFGEILLVEP